jgi:hypothetical protein
MTTRQTYGIEYTKVIGPHGTTNCWAVAKDPENYDIASHISVSDSYSTQDQINELTKAMNGIPIQEEWGEIMGSFLTIYPTDGTVQVNYTNRRIPITDFKQLLQEWLTFITS